MLRGGCGGLSEAPRHRRGAHRGVMIRCRGGMDGSMRTRARFFGVVGTSLFLLATVLAACAAPTVATTNANNGSGINVFKTPNPNDASPTPTFPPFTVGA